VKVECLDRWEALDAETWNGLLGRSASPVLFLTWQWQTNWWSAFGRDRQLRILRVSDGSGQPIGLLPLYAAPGSGAPLRIVGGVDVSDYLDLLAVRGREEEVWSALLQHRAAEPEAWDLHCLRATSPTVALLQGLAPAAGLSVRVEREERCPVLTLPQSWEAYLERLSGKDRHELRRKVRRLWRELPGAVVRSSADPAELAAAMDAFLVLHRRSKAGKARFMDSRMEEFFRAVAGELARAGWLRLWRLDLGEAPLAACLCLEYAGSVALYNSGFDPDHGALSPGIVLLAHVVKDAVERGLARFDFLRGEEPYKYAFGATAEELFNVVISP
jgi:CelD/BcsL family acetyltransferase involved in cellulose biosynthesis